METQAKRPQQDDPMYRAEREKLAQWIRSYNEEVRRLAAVRS